MSLDRILLDSTVDSLAPRLIDLSRRIHANPELRWEETRAAAWIAECVEAEGLTIERASYWGFPVVLTYDTLFLLPMNRRRAKLPVESDSALQGVARAGKSRILVNLVRSIFALDGLFRWLPFGPGLLLVARKMPRHPAS